MTQETGTAARDVAHGPTVDGTGNVASPSKPDRYALPPELPRKESEETEGGKGAGERPDGGRGCVSAVTRLTTRLVPPGGFFSTVFNLAAVCVGAGILGVPSATNNSGLVMTFVYLTVIVVLSVYSLYCLSVLMERLNSKTYEGMTRTLLGRGYDYVTAALRCLSTFGACVAFVITVGDIFRAILANTDAPEFWKSQWGNRLLTCLMWVTTLLPLVIPRRINSLRYVSMAGVFFIIFFVVMLVLHSCMNGLPVNLKKIHVSGAPSDDGIHLFGIGNSALDGFAVFMFAFICQLNSFEVYWDMSERSSSRFTLYSAVALGLCFLLYALAAFFGYLDFGNRATVSVLLLYRPVDKPLVMVAFAGLLVKLCASYALVAMATRNAVYYCLRWDADTVPFWKHCISVVIIAVATLIFGLFIPKINTVFGFIGSLTGGALAFACPAILMMYSGGWSLKSVGWMHYILTYALLIAGVIMVVFGVSATIYGAVQ